MKRIIILMLLVPNSIAAQFVFSDLEYIDIENQYARFGFKKTLKFDLINKPCDDSRDCYLKGDETLIGYWKVNDETKVEFYYTPGPSDDPAFLAVCNGKIILEEAGSTLHFKGNILYIEGSANRFFDMKRKFQFVDNRYQEVNQPFYYIGIEGKLNYSIQIYKSDQFLEKIAYLPKGYEIEVLLGQTGGKYNDLEKILIKTKFGLIGWFNFQEVSFRLDHTLIDGLYFHGD